MNEEREPNFSGALLAAAAVLVKVRKRLCKAQVDAPGIAGRTETRIVLEQGLAVISALEGLAQAMTQAR
jgi:hypothetical protein